MNPKTITVPYNVKAASGRTLEGHGSIFDNVDHGLDVVRAGAFVDSLAKHEADGALPQMYWMHRPDKVPGRWDSMHEDADGLYTAGTLAKTPLGDEMRVLLRMKAVRGLSIGYYPREWEYLENGVRELTKVDLAEVSIVSLAMNPLAQVEAVKSQLSAAGEYVPRPREFERALRDVGLSHKVAKRVVALTALESNRDDIELENEAIGEILSDLKRDTNQVKIDEIRTITRL